MGLLNFFFGKQNSGQVAKQRLQVLLVNERASIAASMLDNLGSDVMPVRTRPSEESRNAQPARSSYNQTGRPKRLVADRPMMSAAVR